MTLRRNPLLMMVDPQSISSGLQPDRHPLSMALWEQASNVRFYQGKVRRNLSPVEMFDIDDGGTIRGLSQLQDSTGTRWVFAAAQSITTPTELNVVRWYGPEPELIHTFTGTYEDQTSQFPATFVDFQHWGDWTIMNSGIGSVMVYKPADDAVTELAELATDVVQVMKKQNQLFLIGTGLGHKEVRWSHADSISNYSIEATTTAGRLPIEELDTGIRAAARLGSNIACYAEDQMALVYWIGPPFYYGQRVQLDGIGAVGKMAVCADGPFNYGVSRNGIWQTDGTAYKYIDEGAINDYFQTAVDWEQSSKIVACRNDVNRTIEFHFPTLTNTDCEGWAFDPATGGWSPIPYVQMMVERRLFQRPLIGLSGAVHLAQFTDEIDAPLDLRTKPLLLQGSDGSPLHVGSYVDEVQLFLKTATNIQFRYGVAENLSYETTWSPLYLCEPGVKTYSVDAGITGVYHFLEFYNIPASPNWNIDLQGFAIFGEPEGTGREQS